MEPAWSRHYEGKANTSLPAASASARGAQETKAGGQRACSLDRPSQHLRAVGLSTWEEVYRLSEQVPSSPETTRSQMGQRGDN